MGAAVGVAVVEAVAPKATEAAMRAAFRAIGLRRGDNGAKMLFEGKRREYNAMHGQSVLIVRVRSGKRSTISELYWPSLRPLCPALFAVKFKNSFPTFAIQTSPADPQIDRDVTTSHIST